MTDAAQRYLINVCIELKKLIKYADPDGNDAQQENLLNLLKREGDAQVRIGHNENLTPLQTARTLIRKLATEWKANGKLERLDLTDPTAYDLYSRLFVFSETKRETKSEEEFWASMRGAR